MHKKFFIVLFVLLAGCKTAGNWVIDIRQYCREHPEECGGQTPTPIQTPVPTAAPTPAGRVCGLNDCGCWHDPTDGCDNCWVFLACPTATPTPLPTATPFPRPTSLPGNACAAVETTPHTMAPGNHCHAWKREGNEIKCLVDSTIRPICDEDHQENWNTFCGKRTHDPDYSKPEGSMHWVVSGASDLGPSDENSAQRWIRGAPNAQVSVTVCIPANKRTPDGCLIVRQGDGCGNRVFTLPSN